MRRAFALLALAACGSSAPSPAPVPGATPNDDQLEPKPLEAAPDAGIDAGPDVAALEDEAARYADTLFEDDTADAPGMTADPIMELEEVILDVTTGEVRGGGEDSIRKALLSRRAAFRACSKRHNLHGTYRATVVVERDGAASDAWGGVDEGQRCMLKALRSARYIRSDGGGTAHLYVRIELP